MTEMCSPSVGYPRGTHSGHMIGGCPISLGSLLQSTIAGYTLFGSGNFYKYKLKFYHAMNSLHGNSWSLHRNFFLFCRLLHGQMQYDILFPFFGQMIVTSRWRSKMIEGKIVSFIIKS